MGTELNFFKSSTIKNLKILFLGLIGAPLSLSISLGNTETIAQEKENNLFVTIVTGGIDSFNSGYGKSKIEGPRTTVVKQFLNQKGFTYKFIPTFWGRAYNMATSQKNTLIYPLTRNKERENEFHWIKEVSHQEYQLVGLKDISPDTLTKEQIIGGDYYAICEKRSISCALLKEFGFREDRIIKNAGISFSANLRLAVNGRASFMLEDWKESVEPVIAENPDLQNKFELIKGQIMIQKNYLAGKNLDPKILAKLTEIN